MGDTRRKELLEQYEDAALALLMDEYAEDEGERLLGEFEEAEKNGEIPEFLSELDEKCKKLIHNTFAKQERDARRNRISRSVAKVAVFLLMFFCISTTIVLSVKALRIPVLNFILERTQRYSSISSDNENGSWQTLGGMADKMLNAPLPAGYELIIRDMGEDGSFMLCYQNDEGYLISFQGVDSVGTLNIDTEDADVVEMELNHQKAVFVSKDNYHLVWIDVEQEMIYELYANGLDSDTFLELAYIIAG